MPGDRRAGPRAGAFGVAAFEAGETRRGARRRPAAPLIVASFIAVGAFTLAEPKAKPERRSGAPPEPILNAPAFVLPPRPPPDARIGCRARIG